MGEDNETFIYQNRPIGQKAAKERLKRIQGKEKVRVTSVTNFLQQFKDILVEIEGGKQDRKIMLQQQTLMIKQRQEKQEIMLEQQAIMIKQKQEKQEIDRIEKEDRIMKMNTSTLDPISAAYFQNRKLEIITF